MFGEKLVELIDLNDDPGSWSIGGKAAGLHRLARAGLPVPPGRVIPAESDETDIVRLGYGISGLWPDHRLAVRSSGVGEDSAETSFAGQFETVLDVDPTPDEIIRAVQKVRASVVAEHVKTYRHGEALPMAVLVMPMVDADTAGIAFTRDPVSGEDVVVIEAVSGVGDRLAAGEVRGERWMVGKTARRDTDLGVLESDQAIEIADLARRVEELEGCPQDIEWARANGRLYLLQARAITTHDDIEPVPMDDEIPPGPWEWDSTHSRMPVSTLLADVFPEGMKRGSQRLAREYGVPIDHIALRSINGFFYIQIVPPAGKPGASPPPAAIMRLLFKMVPDLRRKEKAARRAFSERTYEQWHEKWRTERRPEIAGKVQKWHDLELTELDDAELAAVFTGAVELQRDTFSWNMVTDPAYLVPLADLHRFVSDHLQAGFDTTIRLLAGSSRSTYRDSLRQLAEIITPTVRQIIDEGGGVFDRLEQLAPEFAAAHRDHQRLYGSLVLGYDLLDPTLIENAVGELIRVSTLPTEDQDPSNGARVLASELAEHLPADLRDEFETLLNMARDSYWIREEGESVHSTVLGTLRLVMLEVGRRLVATGQAARTDDAAFLTIEEITGWLQHRKDVTTVVNARRAQHRWAMHQRPPERFGAEVDPPGPESLPRSIARLMEVFQLALTHDQRPSDLGEEADGVAASAGIYTGPARVVRDPGDFDRVKPGEVLIAPITSSTWEVLFPHIGALVTEGGGLLSHPAIVAREYGLPAVVGCDAATSLFRDGQMVTVNGSLGTVTPA